MISHFTLQCISKKHFLHSKHKMRALGVRKGSRGRTRQSRQQQVMTEWLTDCCIKWSRPCKSTFQRKLTVFLQFQSSYWEWNTSDQELTRVVSVVSVSGIAFIISEDSSHLRDIFKKNQMRRLEAWVFPFVACSGRKVKDIRLWLRV